MIRMMAAGVFLLLISSVSDCDAQQRFRLFGRQAKPLAHSYQGYTWGQAPQMHHRQLSTYRNPTISRILDGPIPPYRTNPELNDLRYFGGFHQSHFDNIGIPSGDIGIRGNAYNWRTW